MKYSAYLLLLLAVGAYVALTEATSATNVCKKCTKSVAEQCTTQERTVWERDYGFNKDFYDTENPTNEYFNLEFSNFATQIVQNLGPLLAPWEQEFGFNLSTLQTFPSERFLDMNAFTVKTGPQFYPPIRSADFIVDLPAGPNGTLVPVPIEGFDFFSNLLDAWNFRKTIDINPRGSLRVEVEISTKFTGFENNPFGPELVPNFNDDYRLGTVVVSLLDVLGLVLSNEASDPVFYSQFKESKNRLQARGFFLTGSGIWAFSGAEHGGNPGNPLARMRPLATATKFIRYYTSQNIVKLGMEWDDVCKQWRWYVDGDLVAVDVHKSLTQNLVNEGSGWEWIIYDELNLVESVENHNPLALSVQVVAYPEYARKGRALYETYFYSHMRDVVIDFPKAEGTVVNGTCVPTVNSDYEIVSRACSNGTNYDATDDFINPEIFYAYNRTIEYSVYATRLIHRDNCNMCCDVGTIEGISDQDVVI